MAYRNRNSKDLNRIIRKLVDEAVRSGELQKLGKSVRRAVDEVLEAGNTVLRSTTVRKTVTVQPANQNNKQLYGGTAGKSVKSFFQVFTGIPLSLATGLAALGSLGTGSLGYLAAMLLLLGGGLWLSASGFGTFGRIKRFRVYKRILGQSTHASVEELAHSVGKSEPFIRRDLRKMILEGYFRQGHLDREEMTLITSDDTYRHYEQSRLALEERRRQEAEEKRKQEAEQKQSREKVKPQSEQPAGAGGNAQVQEILNRGNAFIAQIRACNDAIPGEEISSKIDRMENILRRIFQRAERHPEIVPDLKKMMDYYLPMTVKLLGAYADMDAQPHQGENIQGSKREIETALDTLNQAYEKLLDDLFEDTALDVSSDISVLNTLLAQEGLTEEDFPDLKADNT